MSRVVPDKAYRPCRHSDPASASAPEPIALAPVDDLRQVLTALTIEVAALERELGACPQRPTVAAVNKLQAVLGEIELAGLLTRRLAQDVHQHLSVRGLDCRWSDERLSVREREVLRMLAGGCTVSEIAMRLAITVKTVSTYRERLLRKLKLATTAQLVRYGINHHITD